MKGLFALCCLLFSLSVAGQELDSLDSVHGNTPRVHSTLTDRLHQVQEYLDAAARKKVDPRYIEVPKKPWRVVLRYKETAFDVDYSNSIIDPASGDGADWKLCFEPPITASVGIWAGYRGTGISFAKSLKKKAGTTLSFSTTGAKYGFNLLLRGFETSESSLDAMIYEDGKAEHYENKGNLDAPVKIASLYLNGYYVFNGRRYSQAAAYNQSVIQRHSAGSFLLGATWYLSAFDLSDDRNAKMIFLSQGVGRIKLHQASLGIGYGYNLVPLRGLVVNAMAMPTLSIYNRVTSYNYDLNYDLTTTNDQTADYGQWNPETHTWANGKVYRPIPESDPDEKWLDSADSWEVGKEKENSPFRVNLDLRLGVAYNWKNYFVGLQMQLNGFNYKKDKRKVSIFDGYARASLGVRL